MTIVAERYRSVIGIDTHAATHTATVIEAATGAICTTIEIEATTAGSRQISALLAERGDHDAVLVVIEGIGSYGARIAATLSDAGYRVVEAGQMATMPRRGIGKSDDLDAARIARSVLGDDIDRLREPRRVGTRSALRVTVGAREQMNLERTRTINALTALARTEDLGIDARKALTHKQISTIARRRAKASTSSAAIISNEARRLARRVLGLTTDLRDNQKTLTALVREMAPHLPELLGVGPVAAATVLLAWSHSGRIHSEAAFAALAGTCPIPASSGNTTRHRLNRGGDRQLNRAIHTIALTRMRLDESTQTYTARRRAQGRTRREIMRNLKRYITRELYKHLTKTLDAT